MNKNAKFLTISPGRYPEFQTLPITSREDFDRKFFAAQFYKHTKAEKWSTAHICIFADTKYRLTVNGRILGVGPIAAGGDFSTVKPMPKQYYNEFDISVSEEYIDIFAEVQTPGEVLTDYSCGRGGFIFSAEITSPNGEKFEIVSDESWLVRKDTRYFSIANADYSISLPEWENPVVIPNTEAPWNLTKAELPPMTEELIAPQKTEKRDGRIHFEFARIYSAYITLNVENRSNEPKCVKIYSGEYSVYENPTEQIIFPVGKSEYRGFRMRSVGKIETECDDDVSVDAKVTYVHYPVDESVSGKFACSDEKLTGIYDLGRFTLEMCRQTLHLDSPLHQELLACTGDYAIESLMNAVTFGDMRLTALDLIRTSDYLKINNGVMFHTSYSLIFVTMLLDYYKYTADIKLVKELLPTIEILFSRFDTYIENNVIENPPDYMFIEWGELDGFNMHHPPKALGQTSLNAFYQLALNGAAELYTISGNTIRASELTSKANAHKAACIARLFDNERGIFTDGIPAPECQYEASHWLPANPEKIYHTRHSNILAALSGIADNGKALIERVLEHPDDFDELDIQPYFMHYLMEAVRKYGLFEKYGLELLHLWDKQLADSPKGMKEGWGKFVGDCSHAWGATPTYQLPMAISGFEMIKPGYREFKLSPKLYSLDWAEVSLPTPSGLIELSLKKGEATKISVPSNYKIIDGNYKLI